MGVVGSLGTVASALSKEDETTVKQWMVSGHSILNGKISGTIPKINQMTYTPGRTNQTIAAGQYLSGTQTIAGDANLVPENIKTGTSVFGVRGTYTSDATASAGQILRGYSAYVNGQKVIGSIESKGYEVIVPTTIDRNIASGTYLSGAQVIKGDKNLKPENILLGITIFGVRGTLNPSLELTQQDIETVEQWMAEGHSIKNGTVKGKVPVIGAKKWIPTKYDQSIPAKRFVGGTQTIAGDANLVPENIKTGTSVFGVRGTYTSDATASAGQILRGYSAYVNGQKVIGSIESKVAETYTPGRTNQTIAAGQYLSGTQTIAGDANLVPENIKQGVSLFGITGTYKDQSLIYLGEGTSFDIKKYAGWQNATIDNFIIEPQAGYVQSDVTYNSSYETLTPVAYAYSTFEVNKSYDSALGVLKTAMTITAKPWAGVNKTTGQYGEKKVVELNCKVWYKTNVMG